MICIQKKLFPLGVDAMIEVVELVKKKQLTKREQVLSEGSYESWFQNEAVLLDFTMNVNSVYNIIRAANPTPGAVVRHAGNSIKFYDSRKVEDKGQEPGMIVEVSGEGLLVQAKGGCILVKRVELSDGRRLHASKLTSEAGFDVGSVFDSQIV